MYCNKDEYNDQSMTYMLFKFDLKFY
jgi:hypothetical protein